MARNPTQLHLLIVLFLALTFWFITTGVLYQPSITQIDKSISVWIASRSDSLSRQVFNSITLLGSYPVVRVLAIGLSLWLIYHRRWREVTMLIAVIAVTMLVTPYLKELISRTRPALPLDSLYGTDPSYPSGHTFLGTVFFGMVAYLGWFLSRKRWLKWVLTGICAGLILAIGISRVFLEVHYATDVFGGWVGGGLVFFIVLMIANMIFPSRRLRVEDSAES